MSEAETSSEQPIVYKRSFWHSLAHVSTAQRFWGRVALLGLFAVPGMCIFAANLLLEVISQIETIQSYDADLSQRIIYELRSVGFLFFSIVILLCLVCIYLIFFVSIRVYGPQVALLRFINQLKAGNYEPFRKLRKDDELKEIWQALQDLAAQLRSNGQKTSGPKP